MAKKPYFSLFGATHRANAWRISSPHISTCENLHARQKPVFSIVLRAFTHFLIRLRGRLWSQTNLDCCITVCLSPVPVLPKFLANGISEDFLEGRSTVNQAVFVDAFVYINAILHPHRVFQVNFLA